MIRYDPTKLRSAVQMLVEDSYSHHYIKRLRSTVQRPRALPFKGDVEALNELLVVGRQNLQAMENLISLAMSKRGDRGGYQRQYMAAKRQRDRKVLQLEELMTGKPLTQTDRLRVLKHQYDVWNRERDQFVAALGDAAWADRNARIKWFWERKEHEIDMLIAEAQAHGPVKRKYVVKVQQKPKGELGRKLAQALDSR